MGLSVARVSQIEHGEVASFEVIARYVEALGGRLDLVADFGDRTVRLPVSDAATNPAASRWPLRSDNPVRLPRCIGRRSGKRSDVSTANEFAGSQVGSQPRQTRGDIQRCSATVIAGQCPSTPCLATLDDHPGLLRIGRP